MLWYSGLETAVLRNEPVPVQRDEQSGCERQGFCARPVSQRACAPGYSIQDFVFPAITVGGPDLLDRYERQIDGEDPFSPDANDMSLLIHGGGIFVKLDGEGRLMMNEFMRDYTGITDQVTFVGRSDHFQLWDPVCYEEKRQEALSRRLAGRPARAGQGETG